MIVTRAARRVPSAMGALQCLPAHAWGGHDAQQEHQKPSGQLRPWWCADHHGGTIGVPAVRCNMESCAGPESPSSPRSHAPHRTPPASALTAAQRSSLTVVSVCTVANQYFDPGAKDRLAANGSCRSPTGHDRSPGAGKVIQTPNTIRADQQPKWAMKEASDALRRIRLGGQE